MKSEKVDQIAMALAKAQSEMPGVHFNAVNPFLKNKYADLGEMIRVATPVLSKNGLSISQQTVTENNQVGVITTLLHTSGQWIESAITLPLGEEKGKSMAQVAGSIITYLRRYSFGSVIGLYTDEDNDGNKNDAKEQPKRSEVHSNNPALEKALNIMGADGKRYGDCSVDDLAHKRMGIEKALAKPDVSGDKQSQYMEKLEAIATILKSRAQGAG